MISISWVSNVPCISSYLVSLRGFRANFNHSKYVGLTSWCECVDASWQISSHNETFILLHGLPNSMNKKQTNT